MRVMLIVLVILLLQFPLGALVGGYFADGEQP